ncbi:MAG: hypothetical protein C4527_28405 [Candidatus Omnitrophota bacterium]|nr:MAG: hypothetical protein C4527_28405 [Candidatus Omnitrophota bacterium]
MNFFRINRLRPGVLIGIAVIVLVWISMAIPSLWDRWWFHWYNDQVQARFHAEAQNINPLAQGFGSVESHIHFQDLLIRAGNRSEAEQAYRLLAQKNPEDATAVALYARILSDAKQKEELLKKAANLGPTNSAVLYTRIETLLREGRVREARSDCDHLREGDWLKPSLAAQTAWLAGEREKAVEFFKIALDYENAPLSIAVSCAKFLSEEKTDEEPRINPFSSRHENDIRRDPLAEAYWISLFEDGVSGAIEFLSPETLYCPDSLVILARAAMREEEYMTASWLLRRALRIQSDHLPAYVYRGILALEEGDKRRANAIFSLGLNQASGKYNSEFHHRFGLLLLKEGQADYAMPHLNKALGNPTNDFQILKIRAMALLASGQIQPAMETLEQAKEMRPNDKEILNALGEAAVACQDHTKAIRAYADLLNLDFEDMHARDNLAILIAKTGGINHAIGLFEAYLQQHPNSGHSYVKVAEIYAIKGAKEHAAQILRQVLQQKPDLKDREEVETALQKLEESS